MYHCAAGKTRARMFVDRRNAMQEARRSANAIAMPIVVILVGVALVIVAQFVLDKLADTSDTWHWIQHGVILVGGLAIGAAGTLLWASGQQRA